MSKNTQVKIQVKFVTRQKQNEIILNLHAWDKVFPTFDKYPDVRGLYEIYFEGQKNLHEGESLVLRARQTAAWNSVITCRSLVFILACYSCRWTAIMLMLKAVLCRQRKQTYFSHEIYFEGQTNLHKEEFLVFRARKTAT